MVGKFKGILYKPEDFDSTKKYPVILNYYQQRSYQKNHFLEADLMWGQLNIPYFVSNGYIVFVPDIQYVIGETLQSAFNAIEGAGIFLESLSYVNKNKIGLQGHSFAGYQTNCVVTQSKRFAAAVSMAGISDFVRVNGSLARGSSGSWWTERGQMRIGSSLWMRPDQYIKNSPLFYADKISTPILLVCNRQDVFVEPEQTLSFFMALRRMGKPSWMLRYKNGNHGIDQEDRFDYTLRVKQFFDYFLKDGSCPNWLLKSNSDVSSLGVTSRNSPNNLGPSILLEEEKKRIDTFSKIPLSEKLKNIK